MSSNYTECRVSVLIIGCKAYICDFHREQAWERWVSLTDHGVRNYRTEILARTRRIARCTSKDGYQIAVKDLKDSNVWKQHPKLQQWFEKTWLKDSQVLLRNKINQMIIFICNLTSLFITY